MKSLHVSFEKEMDVSLNLTFQDILNKPLRQMMQEFILQKEIGRRVVFEIVESQSIQDYGLLKEFMGEFRTLGVRFAIDDFGTGYSNFEHILKLNVDYIKIDGSLIKDILVNKNNQEIVITIIDFAKRQGFKTIAEFVSNKEIFDKVKELGIDYAQGYYISEPKSDILIEA